MFTMKAVFSVCMISYSSWNMPSRVSSLHHRLSCVYPNTAHLSAFCLSEFGYNFLCLIVKKTNKISFVCTLLSYNVCDTGATRSESACFIGNASAAA